MKKKFIIAVFIIILLLAGLVTSYIDSARVRNGVEPKYTIKIISDNRLIGEEYNWEVGIYLQDYIYEYLILVSKNR